MKTAHTCAVFNPGFNGLSACQNIVRFRPPPSVAENIIDLFDNSVIEQVDEF